MFGLYMYEMSIHDGLLVALFRCEIGTECPCGERQIHVERETEAPRLDEDEVYTYMINTRNMSRHVNICRDRSHRHDMHLAIEHMTYYCDAHVMMRCYAMSSDVSVMRILYHIDIIGIGITQLYRDPMRLCMLCDGTERPCEGCDMWSQVTGAMIGMRGDTTARIECMSQ